MTFARWWGIVAVLACVLSTTGSAVAAPTLPAGFEENRVFAGLHAPTAFAYTPDGRTLVAEKEGRVRVASAAGVLASAPVIDISDHVNSESDRGFLGLAVDSDFASNHYVYLLYTHEHNALDPQGEKVSKLTRIELNNNNTVVDPAGAPGPETTILGKSAFNVCPAPSNAVDCIPSDYLWHSIGTVKADPDGTLWVGTGDAEMSLNYESDTLLVQDERTYRGKILHIDRNGNGLDGHAFCPGETDLAKVCTKVHAKGFRNPFRFSLRPGRNPVVGDVGATEREEVDLARKGGNYGWPCWEGTIHNPVYEDATVCRNLYAAGAGAVDTPVYEYTHDEGSAVAAGPMYTGTNYPSSYRDDVFVADFVGGWFRRLKIDSSDRLLSAEPFASFATSPGSPVDLELTPGGDLAYLDIGYGGQDSGVYRFRYTPGNATPVARASGSPLNGNAPLAVNFDASASTDANGDSLTYSWNFGDGTTGTGAKPSHTYGQAGSYTATVTVSDGRGASATATVGPITPGNTPPSVTVNPPANFRYGQPITVSGSATDAQDGTVPATRLSWMVLQQHEEHTHPFTGGTGSSITFNPGTDHDADSFFKVTLKATDANGSSTQKTVEIRPQTATLTMASSPTGIPLTYGANAATAPRTITAAVGFRATLIAPDTRVINGVTYKFMDWSQGGSRQQTYDIQPGAQTVTARYNALPTAGFTVNRTSGDAPLDVSFSSTSTDTDNNTPLSYSWDWGDGSAAGTGASPTHRFNAAGTYTVRMTVTDARGGSAETTRTITVANAKPVASTAGATTYRAGNAISVTGSATDYEQGALPASALAWKVYRHVGSATRVQVHTQSGTASPSYTPPAASTADTWFEYELTATDAASNTHTTTRRVDPETISARVVSAPAGAATSFAGATTFPVTHVIGFEGTAVAPATFTAGGSTYKFLRWSDNNANRTRTWKVPASNATLTAQYNGLPTAGFTVNRSSGDAPLDVAFTSTSADPENQALGYAWDFGDGGTSTTPNPSHSFNAGTHTVRLTVTDDRGDTATTTRTVTVANAKPVAAITGATTYRAGSAISVTGSATDHEQGTIPASSLSWKVYKHAGNAAREEVHTQSGTAAPAFAPPVTSRPDTRYVYELTATDAAGNTHTATRDVNPDTIPASVVSSPAGAATSFAGATTFPVTEVKGFEGAAAAPANFVKSGNTYKFLRWSDNNTNLSRTWKVPTSNATLTAFYNGVPTALFTATPTSGPAPLQVSFDASGSTDPDTGDALTYEWDFGDGSPAGSGRTVTHTYDTPGHHTAELTVRDDRGGVSAQFTRAIAPGDSPPTATIDRPGNATLFDAGQRVDLAGTVDDAQGQATPSWEVERHRGTETTPVTLDGGGFTVPRDVKPGDWYRIVLTATDEAGLTDSDSARIDPHTSSVRLRSEPPGARVTWNGGVVTTPADVPAVVGNHATLAAPASFVLGGKTWLFSSWSDRLAREHLVAVAANDPLLTARFAVKPTTPQDEPEPEPDPERIGLELRAPRGGVRMDKRGKVSLKLVNPDTYDWRGGVELVTAGKVRTSPGARPKRIKLGSARLSIGAGGARTARLRLSARNRRLVARLRRVRVAVTATPRGGDPAKAGGCVLRPARKPHR